MRFFASQMTVSFVCGRGVILARYKIRKFPRVQILHMHFSCCQQHRIKISSPYHLRKVRSEAIQFYFTNEPKISHQNLYSPSILNNGRCIKISFTGVYQKPNYNCSKFSEPFTKLQIWSVKGSKYFQRLNRTFCWTLAIQICQTSLMV